MGKENMIERGKSDLGQGFQARFIDSMYLALDIMYDVTEKKVTLDEREKACIMELCAIFEQISEELKPIIMKDLSNGIEVKGCSIARGRKTKSWVYKPDEIIKKLSDKGLSHESFMELKSVSSFLKSIPKEQRNEFNDMIKSVQSNDYLKFKSVIQS